MLTPVPSVFTDRFVGAHMSISGGLERAFERIRHIGGTALQIFSRNQRQWKIPPLDAGTLSAFSRQWKIWGPYPVFVHDSYLINLAGTDAVKVGRSVDGFAVELSRAEALGVSGLITHPGSHLGAGVRKGLANYVRNLDRAFEQSQTRQVTVLVETTAGQGTNLGSRFEELTAILEGSAYTNRLGVCFDTCHVFAAGYDLTTPAGHEATFEKLDKLIGLDRIGCFHMNDSAFPCGSKRDRHAHVGQGHIGLQGFSLLMRDARFLKVPMILETPKDKAGGMDRVNLALLKEWAEG
ncbi:deoxyribonuclease IV [Desulfoplanes formicivorans]|uniref:Probable endonuclease 4 n=1 Tax=Desulfoplanes formicivorans TaxID=1592317 RepID=A0A194AK63_9BACT|nr:deoxyribonuclease IV [Desulfoplanes formicivorans]GAU09703.1 endonuclease IV [Desulfoplanes formicivorans]